MTLVADRPIPLLVRWTGSLAAVVALHLAAYTAMQTVVPVSAIAPEAPIMVDLAPDPVAPPPAPVAQPDPDPEPPPPPPPLAPPEVVLPEPPPPPKPPVRKVERPVHYDAPQPEPPKAAEVAPTNAPAPAAPIVTQPQISWQGKLATYLARFKRYPVSAQRANEQGVVTMHLVIERNGTVVSARMVRGSGFPDLDAAAEDWIARASPVPPFPDDMQQPRIEVTVPFRFTLH